MTEECELIKGGHTFGLLAVIDRLRNDSAAENESGIATPFLPFSPATERGRRPERKRLITT